MTENDTDRYAAAWRDRKRRMAAFKAMQFALLPMFLAAMYMESHKVHNSVLLVAIWFAAYILLGIWLNRFRCPRCGNLYYFRLHLKGYMERQKRWRNCRYCDLSQDAFPT